MKNEWERHTDESKHGANFPSCWFRIEVVVRIGAHALTGTSHWVSENGTGLGRPTIFTTFLLIFIYYFFGGND